MKAIMLAILAVFLVACSAQDSVTGALTMEQTSISEYDEEVPQELDTCHSQGFNMTVQEAMELASCEGTILPTYTCDQESAKITFDMPLDDNSPCPVACIVDIKTKVSYKTYLCQEAAKEKLE